MIDAAEAPAPAEDAPAPAATRAVELLAELAEIGLQVARAVGRKAEAGDADPAALSLAYARVSRAVRLTIQLQLQPAKAAEPAPAAPGLAPANPAGVRKDRVVAIVDRIAKAEHDDGDVVDELVEKAYERLDDEDLYGDLMDHPVSDIVARICKDLDLSPDWTALAQELWAKREMESGDVGRPLEGFKPARPLPLAGEGDHSPKSEWWRGRATDTPSLSAALTSLPRAGEIATLQEAPP